MNPMVRSLFLGLFNFGFWFDFLLLLGFDQLGLDCLILFLFGLHQGEEQHFLDADLVGEKHDGSVDT